MSDPVAGLAEMARVTSRDRVVAACVWDHGGGHGPLSLFWRAARHIGRWWHHFERHAPLDALVRALDVLPDTAAIGDERSPAPTSNWSGPTIWLIISLGIGLLLERRRALRRDASLQADRRAATQQLSGPRSGGRPAPRAKG